MQSIETAQSFEREKVLHGSHVIPICSVEYSDIQIQDFFFSSF